MPQPVMPSLRERLSVWMLAAMLLAGLTAVLVCHSLMLPVLAEEQPYVAAGALAARDAQWPVRDYPFFELPGLAVAYAGLFKLTAAVMPTARISSAVAATLVAVLLFITAFRRLDAVTTLGRFGLAVCAAALLVTCPLFFNVTGQALPHDLAALCVVGGIASAIAAIRSKTAWRAVAWAFAAGLCIGSAASLRVMYAPLIVVLAALLPFTPQVSARRRAALPGLFLLAVAAALTPTYLLVHRVPDVLWFATSEHALIHAIRTGSFSATDTFISEQRLWLLRQIAAEPSTLMLLAAFAGLLAMAMWVIARTPRDKRPGPLLLEVVIATTATALTALMGYVCTPANRLHLFAAIPLVILTCILCVAYLRQHAGERARVVATTLYVGGTLAVILPGVQQWSAKLQSFDYEKTPIARHMVQARQLRGAVGQGYVLTLEPLLPVEAGAKVYPQLVMGDAVWRWASSMPPQECARLGLITPVQLATLVKENPPVAVIIDELPTRAYQPLVSYIRYHRFRKRPMPSIDAVWVPDSQTAGVHPLEQ